MVVDIDGEQHVLDLQLNTDLVSGDHVLGYQKDGETILHKPSIEVHFVLNLMINISEVVGGEKELYVKIIQSQCSS